MTRSSEQLSDDLQRYVVAHSVPEDEVLRELAAETADRFPEFQGMQIGAEQGVFMTQLTRALGAARVVEVGTFTGYSSICLARGLAEGGGLLCLDINDEWTAVARRYWARAGLAEQITLELGPALDSLRALPEETAFDLAFIDADKTGYIGYWEELVPRVRSNGVILVDNTLSHGRVVDDTQRGANVQAIRDFNDHASADERTEAVLLPIGDGLTFARKK
ncbi:O-methyltransferase [Allonocardiopsis opalescens]|uniref:Caffeoyl-CoA O-methyltransferase n=1 Tax=Allonocardiopsis opalescens TaxID=1144618 RepID=A0A2T0Q048_9ACTN|nr:O-methyltransferase [Allonocardiopsis opalescens]PRX97146.1 caffeoyl-CoA O-methyltransferase [Allonocardiopsis opalescens]